MMRMFKNENSYLLVCFFEIITMFISSLHSSLHNFHLLKLHIKNFRFLRSGRYIRKFSHFTSDTTAQFFSTTIQLLKIFSKNSFSSSFLMSIFLLFFQIEKEMSKSCSFEAILITGCTSTLRAEILATFT